jgi:hypothetical protein
MAAPADADAARRKVPFGFFGSVLPPSMANPVSVPDATLDAQMARMAQSGVESVRVTRAWNELNPAQGTFRFTTLDRLVAAAALHGIDVIVNVTATPRWAAENPGNRDYWRLPPRDNALYGEVMRQLVLRYGPNGSLWAANPALPRTPVRQWQIWNEPSGPAHWMPRPWAPSYTRLLRAAYEAIKGADRGAEVVAGPLVATGAYNQWRGARDLFRAGAARYLDVVSVHPFTNNSVSARLTARQLVELVRRVRAQMNKRGGRRKEIILTEMTWTASVGKVPRGAIQHFSVTPRGQKARLKTGYRALVKARRKLRVTHAYWYTWSTTYDRSGPLSVMSFNFSGLNRFRGGAFRPMPLLRTYASVAARYEGCRKSANARRCR